jgi:hypothetical protein
MVIDIHLGVRNGWVIQFESTGVMGKPMGIKSQKWFSRRKTFEVYD